MPDSIIQFSRPQMDFLQAKEKYVAAVAGFGSGKTFVGLARIMQNMIQSPGIDQAYLAPSYPLIRDIFYPTVEEFLPQLGLSFKINQGKHIVVVNGLGTIFCRTMDKPDRIVGWKVADAVLDEFDILPTDKAKHVIRKVNARLRQLNPTGRRNQLFITTTPEGFRATYELFKNNPLENSKLIQMSTHSNMRNLPENYIEDLKAMYPENLIAAYLMGDFVNITSGTVYNAYNREANRSFETIFPGETLYIGQDFNVGKMASTVYVQRPNGWHAVDELVDIYDTPALIIEIKQRYEGHKITMYPDASGTSRKSVDASSSDIAILKQAGFYVKANKKNPFVKDRVNSVNAAFTHGVLWINYIKCPVTASCLEQQAYDKNGSPEKNGQEHQNDATGYPIVFEMPVKKPIIITTGIRSAA